MNIQDQIDVLTAARDGKRIQEHNRDDDTWEYLFPDDVHLLDFGTKEYRIAPDPPAKKWRAWNNEEIPVGAVIRGKRPGQKDTRSLILIAEGRGMRIGGVDGLLATSFVLEYFTMDDGSPCGVEE